MSVLDALVGQAGSLRRVGNPPVAPVTGVPSGSRAGCHPAPQWAILALLALLAHGALAQAIPYQRPVDTAPQADSIGGGYKVPPVQKPLPRDYWLQVLDVGALAAAMGVSVWLVLKRRSRKWLTALTIGSLAYFGFYREGCICPIGSLQNVVVALADPKYSIPMVVTATFVLPLAVALYFGRAFCGGVCALGAIQELVVLKPVQVPRRLDRALGLLKYVYLGLAILFAVKPALTRDFLICRFDPFVGFFRRTGAPHMLILGGGFLVLGMFVGRPYCRYLCPYAGLLAWCTRLARRGVTITPNKELDCGLCAEACPYGAIEKMRAVRRNCLYCARCYAACPCDGELAHAKAGLVQPLPNGVPSGPGSEALSEPGPEGTPSDAVKESSCAGGTACATTTSPAFSDVGQAVPPAAPACGRLFHGSSASDLPGAAS